MRIDMDKPFNVKVTAPRSKVKDAEKCYVVQPYAVLSYYIHFKKLE